MIRRMASKLHIGNHRTVDSSDSSSAASSSYASPQSVSTLSHEHRASISTGRTSLHEWVKETSESMQQSQRPIQVDEAALQVRRSKGSYRLSDFIIQRTLGTGSFGRVHLGECSDLSNHLLAPFYIRPAYPSIQAHCRVPMSVFPTGRRSWTLCHAVTSRAHSSISNRY